nr:MAG TPA: hypothetical protein [Caudoviricetes sp.]
MLSITYCAFIRTFFYFYVCILCKSSVWCSVNAFIV